MEYSCWSSRIKEKMGIEIKYKIIQFLVYCL